MEGCKVFQGDEETEARYPRDVGDRVEPAFLGILQGESLAVVEQGRKESQQGGGVLLGINPGTRFPKGLENRAAAE